MKKATKLTNCITIAPLKGLIFLITLALGSNVSAFAAVTKEKRTFTEVTAATETGASTTSVVPAGGLLFYQSQELVEVTHPLLNQLTTVTVFKLKFAIDPERITGRLVNRMEFPAGGVQNATQDPEVVATSAGARVAVNPGETFALDQSVPFDWQPTFTFFLNTSISAHDLGDSRTRVIVPYSVFEGGCAGEGFGSCLTPSGVRFLNSDSDPFDGVAHFAEVIVNRGTKTIESMRSRVNIGISGFIPPGASNGKHIAFFHSESEQDQRCINLGGSRKFGFSLSCQGPPASNGFIKPGEDRNVDGLISQVLTLYNVNTKTAKFTKLKASEGLLLDSTGFISLGARGIVDVENFQLSMGGDLLAFKSKDQPTLPALSCEPPFPGCVSLPARPGVDYNMDGDSLDAHGRHVSASALFENPSLSPTLGPTISNRSTPSFARPGDLLGTDGGNIFYYLSEQEDPQVCLPSPDPNASPSCPDLSGDGDNNDFVLQAFDTQSMTATNSRAGVVPPVLSQAGGGFVSFGMDEQDKGNFGIGSDVNGDGDTLDHQLGFFDANTQTQVDTNVMLKDSNLVGGLTVGKRVGSPPNTDGQVIAYTATILTGATLGNDTPTDIRFIRLPGEGSPPAPTDTTPPVITSSLACVDPGNAPWCKGNTTVIWTVTDQESAITSTVGCSTTTISSDTSPTGTKLTCTASSAGGTSSNSVSVFRDGTAPNIMITSPANGGTYVLNAAVASSYSCSDAGSGVDTCGGTVLSGANFNTSTVGSKDFVVNARDVAGNPASVTNTYKVNYNFSGFLSPLNSNDFSSVFKLGRTIPIKWQLTDANGAFMGTAGPATTVMIDSVRCTGEGDGTPPFRPDTTGQTGLRYDSIANQYIFNWQTTGLAAGCYNIIMDPGDGVKRVTRVQLKP